jgi:hypothetical protein
LVVEDLNWEGEVERERGLSDMDEGGKAEAEVRPNSMALFLNTFLPQISMATSSSSLNRAPGIFQKDLAPA